MEEERKKHTKARFLEVYNENPLREVLNGVSEALVTSELRSDIGARSLAGRGGGNGAQVAHWRAAASLPHPRLRVMKPGHPCFQATCAQLALAMGLHKRLDASSPWKGPGLSNDELGIVLKHTQEPDSLHHAIWNPDSG